jgi:hypothetical protein
MSFDENVESFEEARKLLQLVQPGFVRTAIQVPASSDNLEITFQKN